MASTSFNVGNIDVEITDQSVTLRMRHVVQGHPGCVLGFAEFHTLASRVATAMERAKGAPEAKLSGTICSVCKEPQIETPSGVTCKNGHGGANPADSDDFDIL